MHHPDYLARDDKDVHLQIDFQWILARIMASNDNEKYDVKGEETENITPETTNDYVETGIDLEYERKLMLVPVSVKTRNQRSNVI